MIAWRKGIQMGVLVGSLVMVSVGGWGQQSKPPKVVTPAPIPPKEVSLQYGLQVGKTYRYRVLGIFNGHIPPFAQPNSLPIHIRIDIEYGAEVKKQSDKGTEVAFQVEKAELYLLEKEPDENGKPPAGSEELLFPIPLQQVQDALNVTATLAPTGQVLAISGGDSNSAKINFGFELRKLFTLLFPITFPQKAVKQDSAWSSEDGLLGKNVGKIAYVTTVKTLKPSATQIELKATSKVDEAQDKDQKPVKEAKDTVITTRGNASLTGLAYIVGSTTGGKFSGRLQTARLKLMIDVTRKRNAPDPEKPEEPLENRIDVLANLKVEALETKATPKTPEKPKS